VVDIEKLQQAKEFIKKQIDADDDMLIKIFVQPISDYILDKAVFEIIYQYHGNGD
jgi:hypothetical protein